MSSWEETNSRQLQIEMFLLPQAGEGRFVRVGKAIVWDEDIVAEGVRYGIRIVYPDDYPFSPPRVFLRYPDLPVSVSVHRYTNGVLCLHSDSEWHPQRTGVWIRGRAIAWIHALTVFSRTGVWP